MSSHHRHGPRFVLLLPLLGALLGAMGCGGGDANPTKQRPLGSVCTTDGQCERGLCLIPPGESGRRCVASCVTESEPCPTGGRCTLFERPRGGSSPSLLACTPAPSCTEGATCGANAVCTKDAQGAGACECLPNFHGDPALGCGVCAPENAREGCMQRSLALPEVKGRCRSVDGATVAGECVSVNDCPDPARFGCFGYLPAVVADPPCTCSDLRDRDLSKATSLGDLTGAWYGESTKWPEGFDPKTSGALGPGAQLQGIDLSGPGQTTVERAVAGGEVLTPDRPFDGSAQPSFTGQNALRHGRVVSGTVQLKLGAAVFTDSEHGLLAGSSGTGTLDYLNGSVKVDSKPAPARDVIPEVAYRYRVLGVPLRALATEGTTTSFELVGMGAPIVPRTAVVRISPEPLLPDVLPDGGRTAFTFSGAHGLAKAPVEPGSVRVLVGGVELTDTGSGGLVSGNGSAGQVDYATGKLTLTLAEPPPVATPFAARYRSARTVVLVPDAAFDGVRTRITFSRARALPLRPIAPGSVRLVIGGLNFVDVQGRLDAGGGNSGTIDYETGEVAVTLAAPAATGTAASVTFSSEAAMTLTDRDEPRRLGGDASGGIDYDAARVHIALPTPLHPRALAVIDFERQAEKTLATQPSFDGATRSVAAVLGPAPIVPGSVKLGLGPEVLRLEPPPDGRARDFSLAGPQGLRKVPVAPGTVSLEVGGVRLADVGADGELRAADGSTGQVDYASGAVALQLARPPPPGSRAVAAYAQRLPPVGLTPDEQPDGRRGALSFTGAHAARAPMQPGSAVLALSEGLLPDAPYDGAATVFSYQLERTPVALGGIKLRIGSVTFSERGPPGELAAADGSTGTVDPSTGAVKLSFAAAPAAGTLGSAEYEVTSAEKVARPLVPDVAFDGQKRDHTFSGANGLGAGVLSGSLRIVLSPVPLVPDMPFDGVRTAHRFSGANALLHRPVVPGSVEVKAGSTTLQDARTAGVLSAEDGSSGSIDYATGAVTVAFAGAPSTGTPATVSYRAQTTGAPLTPDLPFDGRRTRLSFTADRSIDRVPVVPGTVTVVIGAVTLTDGTPGLLTGTGGSEGTIDYETGAISVALTSAPPVGAPARATYQTQAAVVMHDRTPGVLTGNDGTSGVVDGASGALSVLFSAPPAPGSSARATFSRRAALTPEPPFDGRAKEHRLKLGRAPITPGSVELTIGATQLRETSPGALSASDGSKGRVDPRTGEVSIQLAVPAPAGTPVLADFKATAALVWRETAQPGTLRASDGSTGRVDARTGVIQLAPKRPPQPGAVVTLTADIPAEALLTDKGGRLVGTDGSSGTIDLSSGVASIDFAQPPPREVELVAAFTQTGSTVERTDLEGIELTGANLSNANLSFTNLRNARLANADLSGADLTGADLTGADLKGAKLKGAVLKYANVQDANLAGADLGAADLSGTSGIDPDSMKLPEWYVAGTITDCARLSIPNCVAGLYHPKQLVEALRAGNINPRAGGMEGAQLAGADLRGVGDLSGAKLKGANLKGADLRDLRLVGADLEGAVLAAANLAGADLTGAKLKGANLKGANLKGLRLAGADLTEAVLEEAVLTEVQAPDAVCAATGAACYDGGRTCSSGVDSCAPKDGSALKLNLAKLTGARFDKAFIPGADLTGAVLARVDLSATDASRTKLPGATLEGATLAGARFQKAGLAGANLKGIRTDASTDLRGADLSAANLLGSDLRGVTLDGAKLDKANLTRIVADERTRAEGASFLEADLTEACLTNSTLLRGVALSGVRAPRASLAGAKLNGTDFTGVDLTGATLSSGSADARDPCHCTPEKGPALCGVTAVQGAVFKNANLYGANLSYTDFRGVSLEAVDLRAAKLDRTDLRSATMLKAKLAGVDLRTAILSGAVLIEANLSDANLSGNEVIEPNLSRADLTRANLSRTTLLRANLSGAVLDQVTSDSTTVMRGANLTLSAIRGCLRADLSDAVLKNAALLQAGFTTPGGQPYDAAKDFNCRMDFEGALLPLSTTAVCGAGAPFPSGWVEAGRATNGVYAKERLLGKVSSVRTQLDCAYLPDSDLRGVDLAGASLRGARLDRSKVGRSDLGVTANLLGAQLKGASLVAVNLEWANLRGADLSSTVLTGTSLEHADLRGANLTSVVMDSSTKFQLAKYSCAGESGPGCTVFPNYPTFRWRQLKMLGPQSDLEGLDLSGYPGLTSPPVDLRGANLKESKFNWTNVAGVNFGGANMESSNFSNANVSGTSFLSTNLKSSNFGGATITAATSFSGSNIMKANFVASSGTPGVSGSYCNAETSFTSASVAYVLLLKISIEGSFPLFFPVITIDLIPGWKVGGQCCFPVQGGIRIGC
ncbi:pentapeptide repeat-containing protein [Myxococcaceae bacterium GXIMD 01537]